MKKTLVAITLCCLPLLSFAQELWEPVPFKDEHKIAKVIFKQTKLLGKEQLAPTDFVPLLSNTTVVFTDEEEIEVTVRDIAYTILEAAKAIPAAETPPPSKYIYYCASTKDQEVLRWHIPLITEEEFQKSIESLNKTSPEPTDE